MSLGDSYNAGYWDQQIRKYLTQDWANRPSPFAQVAAEHLLPDAAILELGTGAGQDGLWFASLGYSVTMTDASETTLKILSLRIKQSGLEHAVVAPLDLLQPFNFPAASFDMVYAQLVLHYFTDQQMAMILSEIRRVLKPSGVLACMVNSTNDHEYDPSAANANGLIEVGGLMKRYFSAKTFAPFVQDFEQLMLDDKGRTPKDDVVGTHHLIRFIGKKHG